METKPKDALYSIIFVMTSREEPVYKPLRFQYLDIAEFRHPQIREHDVSHVVASVLRGWPSPSATTCTSAILSVVGKPIDRDIHPCSGRID
jgi:hypothetical protein